MLKLRRKQMTSLKELNDIVQTLQQTIQQQQEKNNNLERQLIEYRQDILVVENNLSNTQKELAQTKQELQESKIQQQNNLEAQIQRFNTLIDKLKNSEGKTLKFACGSTEPGKTQWVEYGENGMYVDIDTYSAGFSQEPLYFTSLGGEGWHWVTRGATSIYPSQNGKSWNESFRIYIRFPETITPVKANECKWHIQWLAVGV